MLQWINKRSLEQHFHESNTITFVVKNSEAIHLVQPGLMAG